MCPIHSGGVTEVTPDLQFWLFCAYSKSNPYGYVPSEAVAITMIALFGLSSAIHTGQAVYRRLWWLLPTAVLCGVLEILGWVSRLWSHSEPLNMTPFQIQICATIIAPTPLLAATFMIFGEIIRRLGSVYSRLSPKTYTILFLTCDLVSLVVQGVGGGLAATADPLTNGRSPDTGGNIMLGGIGFQLVVIVVFSICALEFVIRYLRNRPLHVAERNNEKYPITGRGELTGKLKIMLLGLLFSTVVLFIRAVYRTIELSDGWSGRIITTEVYFNVLDGAMVILAIYTLNLVHPGWFCYTLSKKEEESSVISLVEIPPAEA
ncbi:hypothetical protein MD484_g4509, partial [Candolleomyces efflorescens]